LSCLNPHASDRSPDDGTIGSAGADARTDKTGATLSPWTFWVDASLHVLFLVVVLIAIFRS
jgi:hypothetical protein